jgi:iron complex transport system permease protein
MRATPSKVGFTCLALFGLLVVSLLLGLKLGTASVGPSQVWAWLTGGKLPYATEVILGDLRMPRLLLAALVGAGLSMSGAVFQGVLRNPLAEPFILGVSGGAAAGAVCALLLGWAGLLTLSASWPSAAPWAPSAWCWPSPAAGDAWKPARSFSPA